MPYPKGDVTYQLGNKLMYAKFDYNVAKLHSQFQNNFNLLIGIILQ